MLTKTIRNATLCLILTTSAVFAAENSEGKMRKELPVLDHHNWIVVANSAYSKTASAAQFAVIL